MVAPVPPGSVEPVSLQATKMEQMLKMAKKSRKFMMSSRWSVLKDAAPYNHISRALATVWFVNRETYGTFSGRKSFLGGVGAQLGQKVALKMVACVPPSTAT